MTPARETYPKLAELAADREDRLLSTEVGELCRALDELDSLRDILRRRLIRPAAGAEANPIGFQ